MKDNNIKLSFYHVSKIIVALVLTIIIIIGLFIMISKKIGLNLFNKSIDYSYLEDEEEDINKRREFVDTGIQNLSMYIEYSYVTNEHTEENPVKNIIGLYEKNGKSYFLLPKNIDLANLVINYTEDIKSVTNGDINEEEKTIRGCYKNDSSFKVNYYDGTEKEIYILQSDLPAICINNIAIVDKNGKNLENKTLSDVKEDSKDKKYDVDIFIEDGNDFSKDLKLSGVEFKGRGNFTWMLSKKGYQIKFDDKVNLFSMGEAKKWVLIPNFTDNTLMRNKLILDLAKEMNLEYTSNSMWVDFWVDGQYQGNYLLTEKVEVGKDRINLKNDDGILVELDNMYYEDEELWFESEKSKSHFVYKDAKDDKDGDEETQKEYLKSFEKYVNDFEKELFSENKNWEEIKKYIDVDSFIKFFFIQEFAENEDAVRTSMFMYRYGTNMSDKIYLGPVWDFDIALGNCNKMELGENPEIDYIPDITEYRTTTLDWYSELLEIPEFRKEVSDLYNNEIKDVLDSAESKINNYENQLQLSSKMNFIKWNTQGIDSLLGRDMGHKNKDTYAEEVDSLRNWVSHRVDYLYNRYNKKSNIYLVKYKSYNKGLGWEEKIFQDGETSGTVDRFKKVEGIRANLLSFNKDFIDLKAYVQYQVFIHGEKDWEENWHKDDQVSGIVGNDKTISAIRMRLCDEEGNPIDGYSIKYRIHFQNYGWQEWQHDGEYDSEFLQKIENEKDEGLDAIQIKIEENNK